jgi:enamine deaminase RidA (YjgF/YER057c/UK114 family)
VLHCAGQASVDADGKPVHEGDMRGQLTRSLDNLEIVLGEAGLGLADVVRLNYYTTDVDAFFESYDAAA